MKLIPKVFQKKAVKRIKKNATGHIPSRAPRTLHLNQPARAIPRFMREAGKKVYKRADGTVLYEAIQVKPKGNRMCKNCLIRPRQNGSSRCGGIGCRPKTVSK